MPFTARLRILIARYGVSIAAILALVGAAAFAGAALTYTDPPTTTETYVTNQQDISAQVDTSVTVENATELYDEDEHLENMPAYFFEASPNLTYHIQVSAPETVETTVTKQLSLQFRATRNGELFWTQNVTLADETETTTGTTWTNTTVNMSEIDQRIAEKRSVVGQVGTLAVSHQLSVSYETDEYEGALTDSAPLVTTNQAFWVDGSLSASRTHSDTATRTTTGSPDITLVLLLIVVGVVFLSVAASIAVQSRTYDLDTIQEEIARAKYDEWISTGEIPTKSEKEYITVDSIEDVVDIAIDSNKRVIYDADLDVYAVVEGDLVYFYTTDTEGVSDWLDL